MLLLTASALALIPKFEPVTDTSHVTFSLRHFSGRAEGVFRRYRGELNFQPDQPEKSSVQFEIDVDSLDTANNSRDEHLLESDYFDSRKHPKMTFKSQSFKLRGKNRYMVTGELTIKGHTKRVSLPVVLEREAQLWATGQESLRFRVDFTLDRTEFGVGDESSLLGSEVRVQLDLEFRSS